jgi:DNA-binding transcriptional MerR regulator
MKTFTISDLATEFSITTRTIRFYEEKELIVPQRAGQNRIYSAADRVKLTLILRGKRLGFSLEESAGIISLYNPKHGNNKQLLSLLDKIHEKRTLLKQQQRDIKVMLAELKDSEEKCLAAIKKPNKQLKN